MSRSVPSRGLLVVSAATLAVVAACSTSDPKPAAVTTSPPVTPRVTAVDVEVAEYSVTAAVSSVASGPVTFRVHNGGTMQHELVLMLTDHAPNALPLETGQSKAVEEGKGDKDVGEVEDVNPSSTKTGVFTLAPGHYVLLCNIVGHYASGMRAAFTVT